MPTFTCPTCQKMVCVDRKEDAPFRPFCAQRCKLIDLGRWFDESYVVGEPIDPEDMDVDPEDLSND